MGALMVGNWDHATVEMKAVWMDVEWDVSMVDCLVVRWADLMDD